MWNFIWVFLLKFVFDQPELILESTELNTKFTPLGNSLVSFQAHSFNDLRQWESLYLKGVRNFKIDPYFLLQASLLSKKNHSYLVLSHDAPVLPHGKYFGFDDLLHELSNNGPTGSLLQHDDSTIRVQLCFKSAPVLCVNPRFSRFEQEWINMVDDFYFKSAFLEHHVEFILDGGGKPYGCLQKKWPRWNSVWIQNDIPYSPLSAFSLAQNASSRFMILNNPANTESWKKLASQQFGSFAKYHEYPFQIWEPNDQGVIHDHLEIFSRLPQQHPGGYCFSSNSDPLLIALYSGAYNAATSSAVMFNSADTSLPIGLFVSTFHSTLFYKSADGSHVVVSVLSKRDNSVVRLPSTLSFAWDRFVSDGGVSSSSSGIFSDLSGRFAQAIIRSWDARLVVNTVQHSPVPFDMTTCLMVREVSSNRFGALWTGSKVSDCALAIVVFSRSFVQMECLVTNTSSLVIQSADFVPIKQIFGVVFSSDRKEVFATYFSVDQQPKEEEHLWRIYREQESLGVKKSIGVGSNPRFAHALKTIGLVLENGNCANTESNNKRAQVLSCDAKAVSTRGTLTYTLGLKEDWLALFRGNNNGKKNWLSHCDTNLLHGAFDVGTSVVPFLEESSWSGEASFWSLHHTLATGEVRSDQLCAIPKWKKALVLSRVKYFLDPALRWKRKIGLRLLRRE